MRSHDLSRMSVVELSDARRELQVSRSLSRPDSPIHRPIDAQMLAVEAEISSRGLMMCSCGLTTDNPEMLSGHLFEEPSHEQWDLSRYQVG
jgi:hypothetical protein